MLKQASRILLSAVLLAACFTTQVLATHSVRIDSGQARSLDTMNISPTFRADYGTFVWLEYSAAEFAKLQRSGIQFDEVPEAGVISFLDWRFDPLQTPPQALNQPATETGNGSKLALVQMRAPLQDQWLEALKANGLEVIQYYPHNTFLVLGDEASLGQARSMDVVRWAGDFVPEFKINSELNRFNGVINNVHIHFLNTGDPEQVLNRIRAAGGLVINAFPAQPDRKLMDAIVSISASQLSALSALPEVIWIGYSSPEPGLEDESSSQVVAGNIEPGGQPEQDYFSWMTDIGLDGSGVVWAITDTGVDYTHPDLNSRIVGGHNYPGCIETDPGNDPNTGGHGTHVAGILGADATSGFADSDGYRYGLGVAPGYSIFAQNPICGTQNSWPPAGGWQELTKNPVLNDAVGTNNSWTSGEGTAHGYQATERTHDIIVRDGNFDTDSVAEPFMVVFSAGNSGPGASTLTAPKEAKNVVVTAGTQTWRVTNNIDAMYNSSSRGPAVDGRFVPTIAAPGQTVGSTRNAGASQCTNAIGGTNGLYSFCTGTSMASPHAAGSLTLITEWWRNDNAGANPSPAMGKALLINTATDITGAPPIPNFDEGWGRVTLSNLFEASTPFQFFDQEQVLGNTGEEWVITVGIDNPAEPLKVTLVWSDAPGAVGANPALVNDLDLIVQTGGDTYLGNVFDNGQSVSGGSADALNNMENVFVMGGGVATIRVQATNISGDAVFYNGDSTDQDFALVCSNCEMLEEIMLSTGFEAVTR